MCDPLKPDRPNRIDQTGPAKPGCGKAMFTPPRKPGNQDPDPPNTGGSDFSVGSILNSMDSPQLNVMFPLAPTAADDAAAAAAASSAPGPDASPFDISIEREYNQITACSRDPAATTNATSTTSGGPPVVLPLAEVLPPLAQWNNMPIVTATLTPEDSPASATVAQPATTASAAAAQPATATDDAAGAEMLERKYEMVDGLINLKAPGSVNAKQRIAIFYKHFGPTRADGTPWSRDDIGSMFNDLLNHGKTCLVHNLEIKSGSGWHCKGQHVLVCDPCRVQKVLKQIGTNLHVGHQGGIPRMILDIAKSLNLNTVDYRDLHLIFEAVTALGHDMTYCVELWAICSHDARDYLAANKRFYGCFMHPLLDQRPASDKLEHTASKGLANLWHETVFWKKGRYVSFTNATRYQKTGHKMEERSAYKKHVIDDSVQHVKKYRPDWVELAKNAWKELESVRTKLYKKSPGQKRTRSYEEEELASL